MVCKKYQVLYPALLLGMTGHSKMRREKIMGAKSDKRLLLLAVSATEDFLYRHGEIVIANSARDPLKPIKGLTLPFEESFLSLRRKSRDKGLTHAPK